MILLLAAIYGTLAFTSNALTTRFLTDQWGRRKSVLTTHIHTQLHSLTSCKDDLDRLVHDHRDRDLRRSHAARVPEYQEQGRKRVRRTRHLSLRGDLLCA